MIWFSYTDKLYIGITFSPQNYHHHQQFLSKLRKNNENDMTSIVWAVIAFGPRVWPLSANPHYNLRVPTHAPWEMVKWFMNSPYTKRRTAACQNWKKKRVVLPQKKRQVSPATNSWFERRKIRQKLNPKKIWEIDLIKLLQQFDKSFEIKIIHLPETEMLEVGWKKIMKSHLIKLKWIHFRRVLKQKKPLCYIASHGAAQPHSFSFAPLTRFIGRFENLGGESSKWKANRFCFYFC